MKNHGKDDLLVASAPGAHVRGDPSGADSARSTKPAIDPTGAGTGEPRGPATVVSVSAPRSSGVPSPGGDKVLMPGKGHPRTVTIASVRPLFGVTVAVDEEAPREVRSGEALSLDERPHKLTFACAKSMCKPQVIAVSSGSGDEHHDVAMQILPATLVVEGEPSHSYGVEGLVLGTLFGAGSSVEIPMNAGTREVSVFDQANPEKKKTATLRAGEKTVVSFKGT